MVSERDFVTKGSAKQKEKRVAIKEVITDPDFVTKLDECTRILAPIDMFIKDVYKAFVELEDKMRILANVDADKKAYLVKLVRERFNFMYGDVQVWILDTWVMGCCAPSGMRLKISSTNLKKRRHHKSGKDGAVGTRIYRLSD